MSGREGGTKKGALRKRKEMEDRRKL